MEGAEERVAVPDLDDRRQAPRIIWPQGQPHVAGIGIGHRPQFDPDHAAVVGHGKPGFNGRGGFSEPDDVIDCGNAGTGVRLILGAAAGFDLAATFTGDGTDGTFRVVSPVRGICLQAVAANKNAEAVLF
jgi:hypothetical protein